MEATVETERYHPVISDSIDQSDLDRTSPNQLMGETFVKV